MLIMKEYEQKARDYFQNLKNSNITENRLIYEFIFNFFGYGNLEEKCKYWFVGIEESGGNLIDEVNERVALWYKNKNITEDLYEYHRNLTKDRSAFDDFLDAKATKIQFTWEQLIRIVLSYEDKTINPDTILSYQKNNLCRINNNTCLLELLPLPDSRNSQWIYKNYDSCLNNKDIYVENIIQYRIQRIKELIKYKKPQFVVLYIMSYFNSSYGKYICSIFESGFQPQYLESSDFPIYIGKLNNTTLIVSHHPTAHNNNKNKKIFKNNKNNYFTEIGKLLKSSQ